MGYWRNIFHVFFLFSWLITTPTLSQSQIAKANCPSSCRNISVPYPFGTKEGCYLNDMFFIHCFDGDVPRLDYTDQEVTKISVEDGTIEVKNMVTFSNCGETKDANWNSFLTSTPFAYSSRWNVFSSVACGALGVMRANNKTAVGGCLTICNGNDHKDVNRDSRIDFTAVDQSCNGVDCCQTTLPLNLQTYFVSFLDIDSGPTNGSSTDDQCRYAFVAEQRWFSSQNISAIQNMTYVPAVLEWGLYHSAAEVFGESYNNRSVGGKFDQGYGSCQVHNATSSAVLNGSRLECACKPGFAGNPYLLNGCQDINECKMRPNPCGQGLQCINIVGGYNCISNAYKPQSQNTRVGSSLGALLLLIGTWLYKVIKKRRIEQHKQKCFKRNGGLLFQQQLSSGEVNVEKIKLFNSKELEKATEKYNINRILGQGGQGTVYKGMLTDGKIVAVKRPKSTVEGDKLGEFINEVVILSQINHRNVVKLLGCCLETEVPLLVYEFIPNGTLSQYIHGANEEFPLTWEVRLRIAIETARAVSYLHSSASVPIYHRDIKSANILLDEKYRAKVADFGTSRSLAIDQTHVTTNVYGTFGYLDPEYFQSGQLTDKSDVYSFGMVLVELLSGQKPFTVTNSERRASLATCFMLSMEENRLFDIVDSRVMKEAERETIVSFADLAKKCLNLNGKGRPSMIEVASVLENIKKSEKSSNAQQSFEVNELVTNEFVAEHWDNVRTSEWLMSSEPSSSSARNPLLSSKQ